MIRWSQTLLNTLREAPQDAEIVSHKLMIRAGMMRKLGGGLYTHLPLGMRALRKIEAIVREEMDRAGAQETLFPILQPAELWKQTGRWESMGPGMFRVRDRKEAWYVLAPTAEEAFTALAKSEISSYRQLPRTIYQMQDKFRDEIRPRFGLIRGKEFIMKDAYSFDADDAGADKSYRAMYEAYVRIFRRVGLAAKPVEADTGDIGGNVLSRFEGTLPDFAAFSAVASQFAGEQQQTPPMFSALKVNGQKLVDLARRGVTVERESRRIFISSIEAFEENGRFMLSVDCSRGTYIRTLCEDIGARLGCGAAMVSLRRTRVGDFSLEDAVTFEQLADPEIRREKIFDIEYVFRKLQVLRLPPFFERLVRNGQAVLLRKLGFAAEIGARLRLAGETGFFALGCVCETSDGPAVKAVKQFC